MLAGECKAKSKTTEFIVTYDSGTGVAQVIGVNGQVAASSTTITGHEVTIDVQHKTIVRPGRPPTKPIRLSDEEFQAHRAAFAFIGGGRAESQAKLSPLVKGEVLRPLDRAPWTGPPKVPWEDWPKWTDPPFVQPPNVAGAARVGIDF